MSSATASGSPFGVAFDIDGVLWRAPAIIPGADTALQRLQGSGVPHVFLTNGGGKTEESKADDMADMYGYAIDPRQVCMSHTPMRGLSEKYEGQLVMVVGKRYQQLRAIAEGYGFAPQDIVTVDEVHAAWPDIYPDAESSKDVDVDAVARVDFTRPVAAVLCMTDPLLWGRETQVVCDVLASSGGVIGTMSPPGAPQTVDLYTSCSDFLYPSRFPVPRFGAGAFNEALDALYTPLRGGVAPVYAAKYGKVSLRCGAW